MINKKIYEVGFIFLFVIMFNIFIANSLVSEPKLNILDSYYYDLSSTNDHVAFENYNFGFQTVNLNDLDDPDLICYNFDVFGDTNSYGGEDYCIYDSSVSRDQCISCWSITVPTSQMTQVNLLSDFVDDKVCDGCEYDTSNRFGDSIEGDIYYNCDQCPSSVPVARSEKYQVIRPRQFLCRANGDEDFIIRGRFYDRFSRFLEWTEYDYLSCPFVSETLGDYGCATDRDQVDDNTGSTPIPFPCAIKDGVYEENRCSVDNDCISRHCGGGGQTVYSSCAFDGSQSYQINYRIYRDTCGGEGFFDTQTSNSGDCSQDFGSDYVCDFGLFGILPADFCRIKEYSSCLIDSDCWNDNGGYDCLGGAGNKICTTGVNGKQCFNNDDTQCDSFRCDSTCKNKLSDGQSCDENSDCRNGLCSGNICGGTGVTVDLAIVDIKPIQVVHDVDLVKGKQGIVRVIVTNYGNNISQGLVNVTFDGTPLTIADGDAAIKNVTPTRNETFDFTFTPSSTGTKQILANVTAT